MNWASKAASAVVAHERPISSKSRRGKLYLLEAALALLLSWPALAPAGVVVTNLTEQDLRTALTNGGTITFATAGTITLTATITITNAATIDAGDFSVRINGAVNVPVFRAATNLTLINLTIANGNGTNGGGVYVSSNATVVASNCIFSGNSAVGSAGVAGANGANTSGIGGNGGNGSNGGNGHGGAIYNLGRLSLYVCQFLTNTAVGGAGGAGGRGGDGDAEGGNGGRGGSGGNSFGGAVYSAGVLVVSDCTFSGNRVTAGAGASGGASGNGAFLGLDGNGGTGGAGSGAGLYCLATNTMVVNCTFSDNAARGGNSADGGTQENGNGANGARGGDSLGGGICNLGTNAVVNCTFSSNQVSGGNGGNGGPSDFVGGNGGNGGNGTGGNYFSSGRAAITNCTFSGGSPTNGAAGRAGSAPFPGADGSAGLARGANVANSGSAFVLQSCLLANPPTLTSVTSVTNIDTATNSIPIATNYVPIGCIPPNCSSTNIVTTNIVSSVTNLVTTTNLFLVANAYGTFTDAGYNLSSDNTPALSGTSHNVTDPKLGSLADNGGPTRTMLLLAGSPAINAGGDACLAADQRGFPRPWGAHCDIGAVEMQLPVIAVYPPSRNVAVGSDALFTVSVATNGVPLGSLTYQWRFNGTNFAGATNTSFTVSGDQTKDVGINQVQVVATNYLGAVTSQVAVLRVIVPVVLATPSFDQTNFWFTFKSETGLIYIVEFKDTLNDTGWTRLSTNVGTGDLLTNGGGGTTSRFFRVVIE